MSDTIDDTDGWSGPAGSVPGIPPAPSVTPGSAPPPPEGTRPQTWSRRGCLTAIVALAAVGVVAVGLVVALALAGGWVGDRQDEAKTRRDIVVETGIETGSTDTDHPPQRDIRLGACEVDGDGGVRAAGTITNWTDDDSDYLVALSFRQGGGGDQGPEFASTAVTVQAVEAHLTTNWSAAVPVGPDGPFTCRVLRIDRWAAGEEPPSSGGS